MNDKLILPDNVVPFKQPEPLPKLNFDDREPDWLWQLSEGTVFLVQQPGEKDQYGRIHRNPVLLEFHIIVKLDDPDKEKRAVRLLNNINTDHYQWVNSLDFSKVFTLTKVVMRGEDLP